VSFTLLQTWRSFILSPEITVMYCGLPMTTVASGYSWPCRRLDGSLVLMRLLWSDQFWRQFPHHRRQITMIDGWGILPERFYFSGVSSTNAVTIYTTTGNIILDNVTVNQQAGSNNTALLSSSSSGNITVKTVFLTETSSNGNSNRGFSATTK